MILALALPCRADLPPVLDSQGHETTLGGRHLVLVLAGVESAAESALLDQVKANAKHLRKRKDASLAVVFVGMAPRQAAELCRLRDYTFPWYCDPRAALLARLDVDFLPTLIVLEHGDKIAYRTTALPEGLVQALLKHPEKAGEVGAKAAPRSRSP